MKKNTTDTMSLYDLLTELVRNAQISVEDAGFFLGVTEELLIQMMAEEEIESYLSGEMEEVKEVPGDKAA